jgi:hypothetical protein
MSVANFDESLTAKEQEVLAVMPQNWPVPDELTRFEISQLLKPETGWLTCLLMGRDHHRIPYREVPSLERKGYLSSRWVDIDPPIDAYWVELGVTARKYYKITEKSRRILQKFQELQEEQTRKKAQSSIGNLSPNPT